MSRKDKAEKIIRNHVLWALGISAVPVPFIDVVGVTFIQLDMLKQLSRLYKVDYDANKGKMLITSLVGTSLVGSLAASGRVIGEYGRAVSWASTILLQGALTYALGQIYLSSLEEGCRSILDLDLDKAGEFFDDVVEKGKEYVEQLVREKE